MYGDRFLHRVNRLCLGLYDRDKALFVSCDIAGGLDDGARTDSAYGDRREERSEQEVVLGTDNNLEYKSVC